VTLASALAVLKEGAAFVRQCDAPCGAHEQLDAETLFQGIDAAANHRRRHALGQGRGGQAALRGDGDKGFDLLEPVHGLIMGNSRINPLTILPLNPQRRIE
jgi:hypothetical protein